MSIQQNIDLGILRDQITSRRERLLKAMTHTRTANLEVLLAEVDLALERINDGSYGLCEVCHDAVEAERLLADPLTRLCLDHLTSAQQRTLEADLQLASQIQKGLLPRIPFDAPGWEVCYHYRPASIISGDYCDLIFHDGTLFFMVGDVAGKGVAAALLMSNLHAMFRALVPTGLPLSELMARASHVFCQSVLPTQYVTLVCGKVSQDTQLEICNAGHLPALLCGRSGITAFESTGMPLGLFCDQQFETVKASILPGDGIVLFTDGISETEDSLGSEYGIDRVRQMIEAHVEKGPSIFIDKCRNHLIGFRGDGVQHDDETLLALQYKPDA